MSNTASVPWKVRLVVLHDAEDKFDQDQRERVGDAVTFGPFSCEVALHLAWLMRGGNAVYEGVYEGRIDVSLLPDKDAGATEG